MGLEQICLGLSLAKFILPRILSIASFFASFPGIVLPRIAFNCTIEKGKIGKRERKEQRELKTG